MIVHHIGKGPTSAGKASKSSWGGGRGRGCACDRHQQLRWQALRSRQAMQDFEFRVYHVLHAAPSVMLVLTRDEDSARTMAERTLREIKGCRRIDVWVARRYLFTVEATESLAGQGASRNSTASPSSFWSAFRKSGRRSRERARSTL
jgi:hypothetical protein